MHINTFLFSTPPVCAHPLSTQNGHPHHVDSVVKIKSLPFDASQLDIINFFEGFKIKPNGTQLVVRSDNKPTGEVRAAGGARGGPGVAGYLGCKRQCLAASVEARGGRGGEGGPWGCGLRGCTVWGRLLCPSRLAISAAAAAGCNGVNRNVCPALD